jgi:hypothetical protein
MTPSEYKVLKAQAKSAAEAVEVAKAAHEETHRVLQEALVEKSCIRREVEKWEPLTPSQKKALLLIYRAGGVMRESSWSSPNRYYVPESSERILSVVAQGLISRQCFGQYKQDGPWARDYPLSEHGKALAQQIEQEGK